MKITSDSSSSKSLTPQRKHRKLLKSGEGEVWSEDVEKVFVQGLHQYWESPWATYARGRSRWRNQFLVDYLAKAGIERSKKQVASHVQVLRNMWKGEKEYHLVAGGEELFLETGLLAPVKREETGDASVLSPADTDDSYLASPISSSLAGFSPPPFKFDEHSGLLQMPPESSSPTSPVSSTKPAVGTSDTPASSYTHSRGRSASLPGLHHKYSAPIPSPLAPRPASSSFEMPSSFPTSMPFFNTATPSISEPSKSYDYDPATVASAVDTPFFNTEGQPTASASGSDEYGPATVSPPGDPPFFNAEGQPTASVSGPSNTYGPATTTVQNNFYHDSPLLSPGIPPPPPPLAANRLFSINLFAEGMPPFIIPVGALTSDYHSTAQPPRLLIRIKLRLPSIDDVHGSPTLHGIHGTISFARPWLTSATCITDVYAANVHHSHDLAPLHLPSIDPSMGESTAGLPESELTRCRWLDSTKQTSIYQRIIMDNDTMAVIVYDLDRSTNDDTVTSFAEVVGFQKYRVKSEKTPYGPSQVSPSSTYSNYSRSRYVAQTSLSCAVTPIINTPDSRIAPTYTPRPSAMVTGL